MPDPQMSSTEFAAKIKAKYPDYANIPDTELVAKMITKYPEYRDRVSFGSSQQNFSSMSPQDLAAQAMRNSGISQPPAQRPVASVGFNQMQQLPISGTGNAALKLNDLTEGTDNAIRGVGQMGNKIADNLRPSVLADFPNMVARTPGHIASGVKNMLTLHGAGQQLGLDTKDLDQASQEGNKTRVIGDAIPALALALMGGKKANAVKEEMFAKPPASKPSIAETITDAINPHPDERPNFQQNVEQHLDSAIEGKSVNNRADIGKAFKEKADAARKSYDSLVEPLKDEPSSTATNSPTYGQLEARLKVINATLKPAMEKGGAAAAAAITAESKVALTTEAAQIRKIINEGAAKRLSLEPEQIAAARAKYGQMYDVADKIQWYLDNEKFTKNKVTNQPSQAPDITVMGAANIVRDSAWKRIFGNPADKAVKNALSDYVPSADVPLKPTYAPDAPFVGKGIPKQERPPPAVQGSTAAEIQAMAERIAANRMARAKQPTLPLTRAKPRWMQE